MRRGELAGLKWDEIPGPVVSGGRLGNRCGREVRQVRALPNIDPVTLELLHRHRGRSRCGSPNSVPVWVCGCCPTTHNDPMRPDFTIKIFMKTRDVARVDGVRLHDLQGFAVTHGLRSLTGSATDPPPRRSTSTRPVWPGVDQTIAAHFG